MVTIVIVDDDGAVREMLCEFLQLEGMAGIGVADTDFVDSVARLVGPDVFLIDLMLRKRCGIEVAQDLREMGFAETPLVAMSASPYLAEVARESGLFSAVIDKPLELDELLLALSEAVPEGKLAVAGHGSDWSS